MPIFSASRAYWAASAQVFSATPDSTGTRPAAASLMALMRVRFSGALSEQFSPTVPMQMMPFTPSSMRAATTFCVAPTSRLSSRANCVVEAGNTPDQFFMTAPSGCEFSSAEAAQVESGKVERRLAAGRKVGHGLRGDGAQREPDVLVTESVQEIRQMGHAPDGG